MCNEFQATDKEEVVPAVLPMASSSENASRRESPAPFETRFQRTIWSDILRAGDVRSPRFKDARETLCRLYWRPVYYFIRRSGLPHEEAQDATQGFLAYFLEKDLAAIADPGKGRFRNFLLGVLKKYLSNVRQKEDRLKRGGAQRVVSWDLSWEEGRCWQDPADHESPDREFDRRWALTVLDQGMASLAEEYRRSNRNEEFKVLSQFLVGDGNYTEAARQLGKSEDACRVALHRLRKQYSGTIRHVIRETLVDESQVEEELAQLKRALRRSA